MKKLLFIIVVLLLTVNTFSQNAIWIDTVNSGPNQEVQFTIKIANLQKFTAFQLDITLPSALDYKANSLQLDPIRKLDHDITGSIVPGNILRIIAYSMTKKNFTGNDGAIAVFKCISKTTPGDYYLTTANIIISDTNNVNLLFSSSNGKYTLLAPAINLGILNINFGSIPLGQINDQNIPITNNGNLPLSVSLFSSNSSEMKCLDSSAVVIQPNQTINKIVRFAPVKKGNKSGSITIKSNDPHDSIKTVALTAVGFAVNEIHIGTLNGRSGQDGELIVSINNMEPFTAFEFILDLPPVMQYKFGSAVLLRSTNQLVNVDTIGSKLKIVSYSPGNNNFTGNSGDILKLQFSLLGQGGGYSIPVSGTIISDTTNTNILSASFPGFIQIASPYLSLSSNQINFGSVSVTDTGKINLTLNNYGNDTLKINSLISNNPLFFTSETFPIIIPQGSQKIITVDCHGITKGSYTGQITINNNDAPRNPSYVSLTGSIFIPNTLSVASETGLVNDSIYIPFSIDNMDQFTAFQFDVTLPSQVQFITDSIKLNPTRINGHFLSYSIQPNGAIRIIAYSMSQNLFKGNSGEVLRLKVKLTTLIGTFPITISNLIIGNTLNQNIATGSNNGSIIIEAATPVELVSFKGNIIENHVYLKWMTATELKNMGFDIERKIGNNGWTKIGHIMGQGTTVNLHNYQFGDDLTNTCYKGIILYRLRQEDTDGKFSLSNEISMDVNLTPGNYTLSQNYPNPFNPSTCIEYTLSNSGYVKLQVFAVTGQLIKTIIDENKEAGYYSVNLSCANLTSGTYIYRLSVNNKSLVKKMLFIK